MSAITRLFGRMRSRTYAPGEVLIEQGVSEGRLFVLGSGELSVVRDGVEVATVTEPGALVGEVSALLESAPSATVRARTEVVAYIVANPVQRLLGDPALLLHVARLLAHRLAETTSYLAASRRRLAASSKAASLREL